MMEPNEEFLEVLCFVAHKEQVGGDSAPAEEGSPRTHPPIRREDVVLYALLPRIGRYDALAESFAQNNIVVLKTAELSPFLLEAARSRRVEFFEIDVGHQIVDSCGRLVVSIDPYNLELLPILFSRYFIDNTLNETRTEFGIILRNFRRALEDEANLEILRTLVAAGPEIKHRHQKGGTLLHFAVQRECFRLAASLIESGADLEARTNDGKTPLLLAVDAYEVSPDILTSLLRGGADVNAEDTKGATPFLVALKKHGNSNIPGQLIDKGANTRVGNALQLAFKTNYLSKVLKDADVDLDRNRTQFKNLFRQSTSFDFDPFSRGKMWQLFTHGFKILPEDAKDLDILEAAIWWVEHGIFEDLLRWGAVVHQKRGTARSSLRQDLSYLLPQLVPHVVVDKIEEKPTDIMANFLNKAVSQKDINLIRYLHVIDDDRENDFYRNVIQIATKNLLPECIPTIMQISDLQLSSLFHKDVLRHVEPVELVWGDEENGHYYETEEENRQENETRTEMKAMICSHIVKIVSAALKRNQEFIVNDQQLRTNSIPKWVLDRISPTLLEECVAEVALLRAEYVGETSVTYYDILDATPLEIVRYLRNPAIRSALITVNVGDSGMSSDDILNAVPLKTEELFYSPDICHTTMSDSFCAKFPLYAPTIDARYRKCFYRFTLLNRGIETIGLLAEKVTQKRIPTEVLETIAQLLCNHELLVLSYAMAEELRQKKRQKKENDEKSRKETEVEAL